MEQDTAPTLKRPLDELYANLPLEPRPEKQPRRSPTIENEGDEEEEEEEEKEHDAQEKGIDVLMAQAVQLMDTHGYTKIATEYAHVTKEKIPGAYTVGLSARSNGKIPDVIVFGLPSAVAFQLIEDLVPELKNVLGIATYPGMQRIYVKGLLGGGLTACLMPITRDSFGKYGAVAKALFPGHHREGATYMQLVWPDAHGAYTTLRSVQQRLYEGSIPAGPSEAGPGRSEITTFSGMIFYIMQDAA